MENIFTALSQNTYMFYYHEKGLNERNEPRRVNGSNGGELKQVKDKVISFLFESVKAEKSQSQIRRG